MKERLNILLENNVISKSAYDLTIAIFTEYFESKELSEEKLNLFFTHLAMALGRLENGNPIDYLDENLYGEVKSSENFEEVKDFWEKISKEKNFELAESENGYIHLHLCNIFNKE